MSHGSRPSTAIAAFAVRGAASELKNFGHNQTWTSRCYRPESEQEVLEILARHSRQRIRILGSLHSWSDIAAGAEVSLDLGCLDAAEPFTSDGKDFVRIGGGCKLQDVLDRLHATTDRTLPTLGAIKRQTIAGAISTGTHGSGRESLSHFVARVRAAAYDPDTGEPRIFEHRAGDELKAARCGLGCLGVILSVDVVTVPKYQVTETVCWHRDIEGILAAYDGWPLTQFLLFPHTWRWLAFQRRHCESKGASSVKRHLSRIYNLVSQDVLFHLGVVATRAMGAAWVKALLHYAPAFIVKNVERNDDAEHILTLRHHLFRHEEMELFVKQSRLAEAAALMRTIVTTFAGDPMPDPMLAAAEQKLRATGLYEELLAHRGSFVHHYPLFFRRVMPEDTLVSMASATIEPYYSASFFTYDPPAARTPFYSMCSLLARCMNRLFEARLHWGKHFPLEYSDIAPTYPEMKRFRQLCQRLDRRGVFRNAYTARVLDLPPGRNG